MKILVVDDQPNIRRLVEISLRSESRQILLAENGEQAIEMAHEERPDLVIMDLIMPGGMNGLEAIEILKSDPKTRDCPVLILSARDQKPERERAQQIGVEGFLAKPFRIEVLQKKVAGIIG